jgi:hypothetical protein
LRSNIKQPLTEEEKGKRALKREADRIAQKAMKSWEASERMKRAEENHKRRS